MALNRGRNVSLSIGGIRVHPAGRRRIYEPGPWMIAVSAGGAAKPSRADRRASRCFSIRLTTRVTRASAVPLKHLIGDEHCVGFWSTARSRVDCHILGTNSRMLARVSPRGFLFQHPG